MNLISCVHCGAVYDLDVLRADHSKDRKGDGTWISRGVEQWLCKTCSSHQPVVERK